ncbi:acyltransferase [Winogradskyella sp.]|nr:acyltransferase [Winogradskyella sp.]
MISTSIRRFKVLDALRGLAALLVCLFHMPRMSFITDNKFIHSAGIFVDLFFILSGFVIYHNYKERLKNIIDAKIFIIKRLKRLYPLHVYTLIIILLVEIIKLITYEILPYQDVPFSDNSVHGFFINLFLLNSTPLFAGFSWNGQSWSISAEIICYLLFVLSSLYLFKTKKTTILTSLLIIVLAYLFYYQNYGDLQILPHTDFNFIRAFIGFFLGILVYIFKQNIITQRVYNLYLPSVIEFITILSLIYFTCNYHTFKEYYYIFQILFAITIFIFSYERGVISLLLSKSIFQKLGLWSYSIYLNHTFMIMVFQMLFVKILKFEGFSLIIADLLLIITTCIYSRYTYEFIEKRFYSKLVK